MNEITINYKEEERKVNCSVCGRNLVASNGTEITAISISVMDEKAVPDFASAWKEIYPELGELPFDVRVCYSCLGRGLHG